MEGRAVVRGSRNLFVRSSRSGRGAEKAQALLGGRGGREGGKKRSILLCSDYCGSVVRAEVALGPRHYSGSFILEMGGCRGR